MLREHGLFYLAKKIKIVTMENFLIEMNPSSSKLSKIGIFLTESIFFIYLDFV